MKKIIYLLAFCVQSIVLIGCNGKSNTNSLQTETIEPDYTISEAESEVKEDSIVVFGVHTTNLDKSFFYDLRDNDIIQFEDDGLRFKDNILEGGVITVNGVGFGVNPYSDNGIISGIIFLSSREIDDIYDDLKSYISSFYGKPDEDSEEARLNWRDEYIEISIRPLHSEEGGTTMIWDLDWDLDI